MAFSSVVTRVLRGVGRKKIAWGTFANASTDSGGDIATGLNAVDSFTATFTSHIGSEMPKVTISAGTVTIVTSDGADGIWQAIGI